MPTEVLKSRLSIKHTVHLNNSHRSFRFPACHPKHEELNTTGRQRTWTAQWWIPAPRCSYHSKPHLLEWVSCRSLAFSNTNRPQSSLQDALHDFLWLGSASNLHQFPNEVRRGQWGMDFKRGTRLSFGSEHKRTWSDVLGDLHASLEPEALN